MAAGLLVQSQTAVPLRGLGGIPKKPNLTIELMNRLKIKYAVAYGFLATTAVALIASLFTGCHVYEHEEVEIIRCPVIEADTIDIPGWDKEIATPEF